MGQKSNPTLDSLGFREIVIRMMISISHSSSADPSSHSTDGFFGEVNELTCTIDVDADFQRNFGNRLGAEECMFALGFEIISSVPKRWTHTNIDALAGARQVCVSHYLLPSFHVQLSTNFIPSMFLSFWHRGWLMSSICRLMMWERQTYRPRCRSMQSTSAISQSDLVQRSLRQL